MANVIARFPTGKAVAYLIFCFVLIAFFFIWTSYIVFETDFLRTKGMSWLFFLVSGWVAGIVLLLLLFALLKQILFAQSRAVWFDGAKIIFLNKHVMAVRTDEIERISLGTFGRFDSPAIVFHIRDGSTKVIPTMSLSEDPGVVLSRLHKAIG